DGLVRGRTPDAAVATQVRESRPGQQRWTKGTDGPDRLAQRLPWLRQLDGAEPRTCPSAPRLGP
ncbi:MAG: hypothetical protein ACYC23_19440, partial [Limisphaerales bacterium]